MLAGVSTRRYTRTGEPVGSEIEPMSSACERHGRATTTTALWTTPGAHRRARPQPSRRRRVAARELEETLTVTRLGVGPPQAHAGLDEPVRVDDRDRPAHQPQRKRWQNGDMWLRWTAAGMLEAEQPHDEHSHAHHDRGSRGRRFTRLRYSLTRPPRSSIASGTSSRHGRYHQLDELTWRHQVMTRACPSCPRPLPGERGLPRLEHVIGAASRQAARGWSDQAARRRGPWLTGVRARPRCPVAQRQHRSVLVGDFDSRRAPRSASRAHLLREPLIGPELEPRPTARATCVIEALGTRVTTALT
jgi:hypothetical protein